MDGIIAKPVNVFVADVHAQAASKIPCVLAGDYQSQAIGKLPQVLVGYVESELPKLSMPSVVQIEHGLIANAVFTDMGIGDIVSCGFIIESSFIDEAVKDGFEDGTLNGYVVTSTNANADKAKLVKIETEKTGGRHSTYAAKIMSTGNQTTTLSCEVIGPLDFSFQWKVSSEGNYDVLKWFVDGLEKKAISGEVDWEEQTVHLIGGVHEITFTYHKDGGGNSGDDCGWIDDITLGKSYKKHCAAVIPAKIGETFSVDVTDLLETVNYIVAFAEQARGIAISENLIYQANDGWENGKIMGVSPEQMDKINGVTRRKIKDVYIGKMKL